MRWRPLHTWGTKRPQHAAAKDGMASKLGQRAEDALGAPNMNYPQIRCRRHCEIDFVFKGKRRFFHPLLPATRRRSARTGADNHYGVDLLG